MQEAFAFQKVNTPPVCFCAEGLNTSDKLFLMLSRVAAVNEGKRNKSKVREKTKRNETSGTRRSGKAGGRGWPVPWSASVVRTFLQC